MQCEECHKNEATVHIQEIIGQKRLALHLCSGCAAEKGLATNGDLQGLDVAALLLQLAKQEMTKKNAAKSEKATAPEEPGGHRLCERCGLTESEFRKHGRMGCADCYEAFRPLLLPLLAEIQRGTTHAGKRPGAAAPVPGPPLPATPVSPAPTLAALKAALTQAVAAEDYEKAAGLRDEIQRLRPSEAS